MSSSSSSKKGDDENNDKVSSSFVAPSPLLKALERDLSEKRSIKDCTRSKKCPAPEVTEALAAFSSKITRQELHISCCMLLSKYLGPLKDTINSNNTNTEQQQQQHYSTIWYCSRMGTLVRFLQFVLEYREATEPTDDTQTEPDYITPSITADAEITKLILQLLRSVTGVVCSIMEEAKKKNVEDDGETEVSSSKNNIKPVSCCEAIFESQDALVQKKHDTATAVALFVYVSVLRINGYVRSRPFLLSPLWKGLCEMATALQQLPATVLQETVACLTAHLNDGGQAVLSSCWSVVVQQQNKSNSKDAAAAVATVGVDRNKQAFLIKILGFLLARLTVFLKLPEDSVLSDTYAQVVQALALLRGIDSTVEHALLQQQSIHHPSPQEYEQLLKDATAVLKPYSQIAKKVERCFHAWLSSETMMIAAEQQQVLSHKRILALVHHQKSLPEKAEEKENGATTRSAFEFGKALLLVKYLEDALQDQQQQQQQDDDNSVVVWHEKDVESLLLVVEDLLLRSLPTAVVLDASGMETINSSPSNRLLVRAMRAISAVLMQCETQTPCIATNLHPGRGRFHGVLVKWLLLQTSPSSSSASGSRPPHPLSNELAITAVQFHILGLCTLGNSESSSSNCDDAMPLLKFLVDLLFDVRTVAALRSNVASLLTRLLRSNTNALSTKVEELIRETYKSFEKKIIPSQNERYYKKRKRTTKGVPEYNITNLGIIVTLLSQQLTKPLRVGCGFLSTVNMDWALSQKTLQAAAVHTALSDFSKRADFALLLQSFLMVRNGWNPCNFRKLKDQFEFFSVAVLRQVLRMVDKKGDKAVPIGEIESICKVLELCTSSSVLDAAKNNDSFFMPGPVFCAIRILGVVGRVLQPSSPKPRLKELAQCFHRLLSCSSWAIQANAMTSLVKFASTIPSVHKDVLPSCVPTNMQQLLQCRLKGKVQGKAEYLAELQKQCSNALIETIPQQRRRGSDNKVFPVSSSFVFPTGSYFMTMPTVEGREAVVIFPPGAMEDIRYMLNAGDDDDDGGEGGPTRKRNIQTLTCSSKMQLQNLN